MNGYEALDTNGSASLSHDEWATSAQIAEDEANQHLGILLEDSQDGEVGISSQDLDSEMCVDLDMDLLLTEVHPLPPPSVLFPCTRFCSLFFED